MNRIQSLFLAVLISGSYANSVASNDTRILVELPEMMQQHMLSNMRDHLAAINEILVYLNNDEMGPIRWPNLCPKECARLVPPCIEQQADSH